GATRAQARAALKQYKDVMEAAESIFEGKFDNVNDDDEDVEMDASGQEPKKRTRLATPEEDDDEMGSIDGDEDADEDDVEDYADYDSDFGPQTEGTHQDVDPYAGIFFSKDRREEVIEVEEDAETLQVPGTHDRVKIMSQGQWMKGCPEGSEQSFLFQLYSLLTDESPQPCPQGCGATFQRSKTDFFGVFPEFSTYINHVREVVRKKCQRCHSEFCTACGEPISAERTHRPGAATDDNVLFHCSNLQGVILGVGLGILEQQFVEDIGGDSDPSERTSKRRKTSPTSEDASPSPVLIIQGRGSNAKGGTGYAGDQKEDMSGQMEAWAAQKTKDLKIGNFLKAIREYLPNLHREGGGQTSDYLVHPTALAHLRRRFNFICSSLLKNDSLADMSERSVLYFELLEWLETISNHEALASMMAMPIMMMVSVVAVSGKKSATVGGLGRRERTIIYEGSPSPRELLEAIAIQAQAALKGLESIKPPEPTGELTEEQKRMPHAADKKPEQDNTATDENKKMSDFCNRILNTIKAIDRSLRETKGDEFVKRLHASLPQNPSTGIEKKAVQISAGATEEAMKRAYVDWATSRRFEYCDLTIQKPSENSEDQTPHYKFYYNNEARMLANADIPKRSLAIAKELAILSTNLPVAWDSSIFLRVDETRVDVIKALITGPEGTPYLFDIFLGPSYNQLPPSVKYMTTNGGKFRFNPNLYADGKVCLSLLGTWSGPGWVAGKSTLLQVLISIQSMILCDEPYLNEPGWASDGGTPQSLAYSANVRRMVVKTAMLGNLRNPPEPFEEVIRTHFRLKARSISAQLDEWLAKDDNAPTIGEAGGFGQRTLPTAGNNGFAQDVQDLKTLLQELEDEQ
ncbi:Baculoviral IAP repeat-containing protein 6, partial [Leucoagaricus sp. SymC.cos]